MKKAVGYIRVSTTDQARDGESLPHQRRMVELYCANENLRLVKIYEDAGISGARADRPALVELLESAKRHEFEFVIVRDISRFGRSARDILNHIKVLEDNDVAFISLKENIVPDSPYGKFNVVLLSGLAELEKETIKSRMGDVRIAMAGRGELAVGRTAYGYVYSREERMFIPDPVQSKVYARIVRDYVSLKKSLVTIALDLNEEHVPTQNRRTWCAGSLSQILKNPVYYSGKNTLTLSKETGSTREYAYVPLVTHAKWKEIQDRLDSAKVRSGRPSKAKDTYLLYRQLICGYCGARIGTYYDSEPLKNGSWRRRYGCAYHDFSAKRLREKGRTKCPLPRIDAERLEKYVWDSLCGILFFFPDKTFEAIEENSHYLQKEQQKELQVIRVENEITVAKKKVEHIEEILGRDGIDLGYFLELHSKMRATVADLSLQLREAQDELDALREIKNQEQSLYNFARDNAGALRKLSEIVNNLPFAKKQRLIEGLLAYPITVGPVPQGEFYPEDMSDVDMEMFEPKTFTIWDCIDLRWKFNPEVINEVLGLSDNNPCFSRAYNNYFRLKMGIM